MPSLIFSEEKRKQIRMLSATILLGTAWLTTTAADNILIVFICIIQRK